MKKDYMLASIYHPLWKKFEKHHFDKAVKLFSERFKVNGINLDLRGKVCLDAGCGSGRFTKALLNLGAKTVRSVDLNISIAKKNIKNKRVVFKKCDLRNLPFPDEYFDFIICNGVIHHIEDYPIVVKELKRVLKKGGSLFLFVFGHKANDWKMIDALRSVISEFPMERFIRFLKKHFRLAPNPIFAFCDLMYAPVQIKFTKKQLRELFKGFKIRFLNKPYMDYDSKYDIRLIVQKK